MRITISINDKQYPEVIDHIKYLRNEGENVSKFFVDAASESIFNKKNKDKERLKLLIKEVIEEENFSTVKFDSKNESSIPEKTEKNKLRNRLNNMFDEM